MRTSRMLENKTQHFRFLFFKIFMVLLGGLGAGEMRWRGLGSRWRSIKVCDPLLGGKLQNPPSFKMKQKMMVKYFFLSKS